MIVPDYRDTAKALVHKDLRLSFDGNRYCVPPRYVGRRLTIKADVSSVTFYDQYQEIASYARCWQRGQTLGAERFQKELLAQLTAAQRSAEQQRLVSWRGFDGANPVKLAEVPAFAPNGAETKPYSLEEIGAMLKVLTEPSGTPLRRTEGTHVGIL